MEHAKKMSYNDPNTCLFLSEHHWALYLGDVQAGLL
jgi:hypothetical protein